MLRAFEPWHLVILVVVVAVLFGAKRLPDSARSIGQSLRIFRSEMNASPPPPIAVESPAEPPQSAPQSAPYVSVPASQNADSVV